MPTEHDTPIETRYPWLKMGGDVRDLLPEDPQPRDFAKAYATILIVYQAQRERTIEELERHRKERRETLDVLKTISKQQTVASPMPFWAKAHSAIILIEAAAIVWMMMTMVAQERRIDHLHPESSQGR
jgi:hypothetical protein